jgi:hypothetical protein
MARASASTRWSGSGCDGTQLKRQPNDDFEDGEMSAPSAVTGLVRVFAIVASLVSSMAVRPAEACPEPSFPDYVAMQNSLSPNQIMAMVHTDDRLRRLTPQQIVNNMRVAQQELDYINTAAKPVQFKGYFIGDCKVDKTAFLSQRLTAQYIYHAYPVLTCDH